MVRCANSVVFNFYIGLELRKREISDLLKRERGYVNTLKSLTKVVGGSLIGGLFIFAQIYLFEFRNNRSVTKSVTLQDLQDLFCNIEDIFEVCAMGDRESREREHVCVLSVFSK